MSDSDRRALIPAAQAPGHHHVGIVPTTLTSAVVFVPSAKRFGRDVLKKRKECGRLADLDAARGDRMVASLSIDPKTEFTDAFRARADPGRRELDKFPDDELAELIAREPGSRQGLLASSILRNRDSWRTPAQWALGISAISLLVAITALARTFLVQASP